VSTCHSCHAPIVWAVTTKGKRMPLDDPPSTKGTFVIVDGIARKPDPAGAVPFLMYTSHFATCPNAERHRKARS